MRLREEIVGRVGGVPVRAFTLDDGVGLTVEVWTWGATLVRAVTPDRSGARANVVVRWPDLAGYTGPGPRTYVGATMGRFCRIVAGSRFTLDGREHVLPANEGRHHVHGGPRGFDRAVWRAHAEQRADALLLRLEHTSPDGDQGYPGTVAVRADHVVRPGRLEITYTARTTAPTVIGLTHHAFWNLAGGGPVDGHVLALHAGRVVAVDAEHVPRPGPPVTAAGVLPRADRPLGATRVDAFAVLDGGPWAAELTDPGSGRVLRVHTDQTGMGVYTGDGLPRPRAGVCLQPGPWPDAPNRPDFPSARLDPGQEYRATLGHAFGTTDADEPR